MSDVKLIQGDCLKVMQDLIDDGVKVDLVLTDPPYGTMQGGEAGGKLKMKELRKWDKAFPPQTLFNYACKLLRQNGKLILFSQQPYTSQLILNTIPRIQFIQLLYWQKNTAGNFLCATQNAMQFIEDIAVFRKDGNDYDKSHPLRQYFLDEKEKTGLSNKELNKILGSGMASHYFTNGIQFTIPTAENYKKLQTTGYFKLPFDEIKRIDKEYKNKYPSVFNLWENGRAKSNVLNYKKDNDGFHPTQKPVSLLIDLIKTYSNENDTILDFTMGSGSTGVACLQTNRNFIGIELEPKYYEIAEQRIKEAKAQRRLI